MPYRIGILHGRDLSFENKLVVGKCIALLLAISEWMKSKNNEDIRKEKWRMENMSTRRKNII